MKNIIYKKGLPVTVFKSSFTGTEHRKELTSLYALLEADPYKFPNRVRWSRVVQLMQERIEVLEAGLGHFSEALQEGLLKQLALEILNGERLLEDIPKMSNVAFEGKKLKQQKKFNIERQ